MTSGADWLGFGDERPRYRPPDPGANRAIDLTARLGESPAASASWNQGTNYAAFPTGPHIAVIIRAEWKTGSTGQEYLVLVWSEMARKRGCSLLDPVYVNAGTQPGRQYALKKLSLIASAAGIHLPPEAFQPSQLLGAVAVIEVALKPHWSKPGQTVLAVKRYLPAPAPPSPQGGKPG